MKSKRIKPSDAEVYAALHKSAKSVIARFHEGKMPDHLDNSREVFINTIVEDAWYYMRKFRHGGPVVLEKFAFYIAMYSLRRIQVKSVKLWRQREAAKAGIPVKIVYHVPHIIRPLSKQLTRVLCLLIAGYSTVEVAARRQVATATVKGQKFKLCKIFKAHSVSELVTRVLQIHPEYLWMKSTLTVFQYKLMRRLAISGSVFDAVEWIKSSYEIKEDLESDPEAVKVLRNKLYREFKRIFKKLNANSSQDAIEIFKSRVRLVPLGFKPQGLKFKGHRMMFQGKRLYVRTRVQTDSSNERRNVPVFCNGSIVFQLREWLRENRKKKPKRLHAERQTG